MSKKSSGSSYSSLIPSVCVETLGAAWVRQIGSRVMEQSGDNGATQFLIQRIAINVQRGNAQQLLL